MKCKTVKQCTITVTDKEQKVINDILSILTDHYYTAVDLSNDDVLSVLCAICNGDREITNGNGMVIHGIKLNYEYEGYNV